MINLHQKYLILKRLKGEISMARIIDGFLSKVEDSDIVNGKYTIPEGVTSIGCEAFCDCESLTSITIPNSVTSIGKRAFAYCTSLTSITIPNSVTSIGKEAFYDCKSLTSITIPNSVTSIGDYAFRGCTSLTSITIPDSVTSIGGGAFIDCTSLYSITIQNSVTSISEVIAKLLNGKLNIKKIKKLKEKLSGIVDYAFRGCTSLTSITIPDSVTSIGDNAFENCTSLTSITIPKGVTSIGEFAFYNCRSLTSIIIPEGVTSIGEGAFYGCTNLTSITIPEGVTSIGHDAFNGCTVFESITVAEGNAVYHSNGNCLIETNTKTLLAGCKNSVIPTDGSVTSIGNYAFIGCTSLTSITIPDSVTSIGDNAFSYCKSLTSITIPDSVTSIGHDAFNGCTVLESITVADGNSVYHSNGNCLIETNTKTLLAGCKNSAIPTDCSVTSIGEEAFCDCTSLTSITIPNSVTSIGERAFLNCTSLTSITIPNSVTSIGERAFRGCKSLTSITIPNSVTSISDSAFAGCDCPISIQKHGKKYNLPITLFTEKMYKYISENDVDLKRFNKVVKLAEEKGVDEYNITEFEALACCLGLFEDNSVKTERGKNKDGKPNMVPVGDIASEFLQRVLNNGELNLGVIHSALGSMQTWKYNPEFAKFVTSKTNWGELKDKLEILPRIYDWFKDRTELDIDSVPTDSNLPSNEENRFKVRVYVDSENGIQKLKWQTPTVENLMKEFARNKFSGVVTERDQELAEYMRKFEIYNQKHFDKAKEIDKERIDGGIKDVLNKKVKQDRIESLDDYRAKTQILREQIISDGAEIISSQVNDTSNVFTYDVLEKSDPANFAMGCMTSCCATLYNAGGGAMRAMIIHPDIQPMVIRDFDNNIVSFGIIYVNREQGYAVVNDFEVNRKYAGQDEKRRAIYDKAMEGIDAFVRQYNSENPEKPIKVVTSGISPNWQAINDFIRQNPSSQILKAIDFNDYKYAGSGSWAGDWQKEQYVIWKESEEKEDE